LVEVATGWLRPLITTAGFRDIYEIGGEKSLIGCVGGSCDPRRDFPMFVEWSLGGRFDPSALVTNRYTSDELNRASTTCTKAGLAAVR
jgi:Zn-dependent alcohol dehydrogenase